jgi:hypothetical protein
VRPERGINTFVHVHDDPTMIAVDEHGWDMERIATLNPGRLVGQRTEVFPGGNTVLSYLEIAGPDAAVPAEISDALDQFEAGLGTDTSFSRMLGDIAVRFHLVLRPAGFDGLAAHELRSLRDQLEIAVSEWVDGRLPVPSQKPLVVWREADEEKTMFTLDEHSRHRVQIVSTHELSSYPVTVGHTTRQEFEKVFGSVFGHIIPVVVGLPHSKVVALGGVELRDKSTGEVLMQWQSNQSASSHK